MNKFIINSIHGFILPTIYNYLLDFIRNINTKTQLKDYLFSLKHSFFLGTSSVLLLNNFISKITFYNLLGYSNGYIIYDLINSIKKNDKQMIFHHVLMLITILSTQFVNEGYIPNLDWIMARIYICEFTNIFLYLYIMLTKLKYNNKNVMNFLKGNTLILYTFLRIYNFNYIQYYLFINNINICFYLMLPITFINHIWYYKIINKVIKNI